MKISNVRGGVERVVAPEPVNTAHATARHVGERVLDSPRPPNPGLSDPETWLESHGDYLYRYAFTRLQEPVEAEDAVQETLLAAIQARRRYAGQASERTWLVGILKHKITDHIRKSIRERPVDKDGVDGTAGDMFDGRGKWKVEVSAWADPESALDQARFWQVFSDCIDNLPARLAKPFVLKEIDGMSSNDICAELDISTTNNLWVMLSRARMRLRGCLEQNWFAETTEGK